MAGISPYMLKRLYVEGSLKNVDGGFQFALKNTIDSGTLMGLAQLQVDDRDIDMEQILVGKETPDQKASEITYRQPIYFHYGQTLFVMVKGETLAAGTHKINLVVNTAEIGRLSLPIEATL